MAKKIVYKPGYELSVALSDPATLASGDPVRYGNLTGLALTDEGDGGNDATKTTVNFGPFVADLSVKGVDDGGNSAVAVGDAVWYVDADTPKLSKKSSGYFYGVALEAVGAGETDTIRVMHVPAPGTGTLASGSVGSTQLASSAVTAAKLASSAVTTTKILAQNVTEPKIEEASLSGLVAKVVADANVIGGLEVIHRIDIAAGALGNTDVVLTHKTRITDAWLVLRGAGVSTTTLQVKNGANAITDAMAASGSDQAIVRAASLNDAYWEVAAGGTLRVTSATGATQPDATVFVRGMRVA
jgi:hypothetical protein